MPSYPVFRGSRKKDIPLRFDLSLRREKGHDIVAACGQLRLQTKQAEREARPV
jgi:adenine C2-methylase RlmN of 23S rRNA A2503 and tRNA A37